MNVELLTKVKNHILEEPLRLYMRDWIRHKQENGSRLSNRDYNKMRDYPQCGTVGCIAGWAVILAGKEAAVIQRRVLLDGPYCLATQT